VTALVRDRGGVEEEVPLGDGGSGAKEAELDHLDLLRVGAS
jgi:hypothetical protein